MSKTIKEVQDEVKRFNIQFDNLCQVGEVGVGGPGFGPHQRMAGLLCCCCCCCCETWCKKLCTGMQISCILPTVVPWDG